ncbi:MAG: tRNA lysidine(34) synthetase TilS [Gammaproteobacteria bacterium]
MEHDTRMAFGAERLAAALAGLDPDWPQASWCVALSGGVDSTVLLHAMRALQAGGGLTRLRALHVDHGLQPAAPAWTEHCRRLCEGLGVPFAALRLGLAAVPGASVEALARELRYAAFGRALAPGEWLLTAHHRDDQLETVLIQLLRGAGVAGLAAMPARAALGRGRHGRPLLAVDRGEIDAYAREHGLDCLRDPMNESLRFDRGYLRMEVLPRLRPRWPGLAATVARSASHMAEARRLLDDLAAMDAAGHAEGRRLALASLAPLSRDRRANMLRWWIHACGLRPPPAARLAVALDQLMGARSDAQPLVRWAGGELRRYRGRLYAMPPLLPMRSTFLPLPDPAACDLDLGSGAGRFQLRAGIAGGLRLPLMHPVEIRFRAGGEGLQPAAARPRKRLKDLCQEAGIVPWMRHRLPLVHSAGRLVAIADLWIDAAWQAGPGEPALAPAWNDRPELF